MAETFQRRAHYKECCIYQIYPASFCDGNGDGMGDIPGIISKLDYLKDLGCDVIWLSPIYQSPFVDNGYDVSDYTAIDPRFGTLDDVDALIAGLHERGIKLVMDLIINHTSNEHYWFKESRKSKDNPYRDFYWWRPPKWSESGERLPPNNWREEFSNGSAWQWDEHTGEYYLHLYAKEQPDLNWENPKLRQVIYEDVMKWWLDRGVDGFRMDVINLISKNPELPDASIQDEGETWQWSYEHTANGPRIHEFLKEMNKEVLSLYPDIITVGETPFTHHDFDTLVPYVLPENNELQMIFQFEQTEVDGYPPLVVKKYTLPEFKQVTSRWQTGMQERGGWNANYLENHDVARSVSRFGDDSTPENRVLTAKLLALLQCTLSGTLYVYQGEEIAMANIPPSWSIEEYKDVASQAYYHEEYEIRKKDGQTPDMSDVMHALQCKSRDCARTPMQWSDSTQAGFSTGIPWMRVNDDYREWNVEAQKDDPKSVLSFWKDMIKFRKRYLSSTYGLFEEIHPDHPHIYSYTKTYDRETMLVIINFANESVDFDFGNVKIPAGKPKDQISNLESGSAASVDNKVSMRPYEARAMVWDGQ
ncbi:alpha amylase [Kockovaella imperatae]|uniref:Alpha amylase n=1 Tax=Kockovaella imperatae TaxID=4999 RepID=A0A1Y1UDW6_9TREE|nr:alpha amylase [Kockovaella imperatae]ORX36241.1 alpha amylase [Kockovaella imperatae]